MIDSSAHNPESEAPHAFALSIECDPPIVEPGQYLTMSITDVQTFDAIPILPVRVIVSSHTGRFSISREMSVSDTGATPYTVRFLIDPSFPLGRYDVHVSTPSNDATVIGTFQVARLGFRDNVERLRSLLMIESEVSSLDKQGKHMEATEILGVVARAYSRLECFTLAVGSYRDLASLTLRGGRTEEAKLAIRNGLFQALLAAHQRSTPAQMDQAIQPDSSSRLCLSRMQVHRSDIGDLLELASSVDHDLHTLVCAWRGTINESKGDRDYIDPVVDILAYLGEHDPQFLLALKNGLSDPRHSLVCIRALSLLDVELAVELLPDLCAVASRLADSERDVLLREALANFSAADIYPLLSVLLTSLPDEHQRAFLAALFEVIPADWLVGDEELFVYSLHDHTRPITVLPNRASVIQALLPFITTARFSDLQRSVRALNV